MYDTIIVGSGPAGLSAALYAKRANMNILLLEKMFMGTGQVAESGRVDNYLGMPGMSGYEMGEAFRKHAEDFGVEFCEGEAKEFRNEGAAWEILLSDGRSFKTKTVIYAAGAGHRHLGIPGEEELAGRGVSYCAVCDGSFYRAKTVAVAGGGNTALDDAGYLSELCGKVYLIHRRSEFRGAPATLEKLKKKENVTILTDTVIREVKGDKKVSALVLSDGQEIAVDGLFVAIGMMPQTECLKGIVELDETGYIRADESGRTSAAGFFAAGDVRTKRLRQIVTAVSDGANAVASVKEYLGEH